ncbi:MAG: SprB repeat-containing protein, partial [Leeuwenhoekiella sp.]
MRIFLLLHRLFSCFSTRIFGVKTLIFGVLITIFSYSAHAQTPVEDDADTATITVNTNLTSSFVVANVKCFDDASGTIDLVVTGGLMPYSYLWSNGATTEDLIGIPKGNYSVSITDAAGCTISDNVLITQPAQALAATTVVVDNLCYGDNNGSIDVTASGGTSPYTYSWSNGANTEDVSGLSSDEYTITITDANGCELILSVPVKQPSAALSASSSVRQILCYGDNSGAADLTVAGGTAPYTFDWSNGSTNEDLTGLTAGDYEVIITDANKCQTTHQITISQPGAALSALASATDILCYDDASGSIDVAVKGGTAPYTYLWDNGASTEDISSLEAGIYELTITDANGCETIINAEVTQPSAALSASSSVTDVLCFGDNSGSVDVTVNGGTAPYKYIWDNGASTEDISSLTAGIYELTITDANGCETTINTEVTQPSAALSASSSVTDV